MPNLGSLALQQYNYFYTNTNSTGSIRNVTPGLTASALLHTITVNTAGVGSNITVYNSAYTVSGSVTTITSTGSVVAVLDTTAIRTYHYDVLLNNGLVTVTSGSGKAADITIAYR